MSSGHLFVKIINIISWWPKAQTYLENIQKCESWFSLGDNTVDNPWVFSFIFYGCPGFFFCTYYILFQYSENKILKPWGENLRRGKSETVMTQELSSLNKVKLEKQAAWPVWSALKRGCIVPLSATSFVKLMAWALSDLTVRWRRRGESWLITMVLWFIVYIFYW